MKSILKGISLVSANITQCVYSGLNSKMEIPVTHLTLNGIDGSGNWLGGKWHEQFMSSFRDIRLHRACLRLMAIETIQ